MQSPPLTNRVKERICTSQYNKKKKKIRTDLFQTLAAQKPMDLYNSVQ